MTNAQQHSAKTHITAFCKLPTLLLLIIRKLIYLLNTFPYEKWTLSKWDTVPVHLALRWASLWQPAALRHHVLWFTWSEDIRTALLCYSLLKVHDQAMLTRDGESLVLFSSLWLWDGLWGRNGLWIDLGNGQSYNCICRIPTFSTRIRKKNQVHHSVGYSMVSG